MSVEEFNKRNHTIYGVIENWARETPDKLAIIIYDTGKEVTYKEYIEAINILAFKLFNMGFRKDDIIATSLPFIYEHTVLGLACAKLGVMWCPLDLRLKPPEIMRNLDLLKDKCKMYCHLGKVSVANFGMIGAAVQKNCQWLDYVVQFSTPDDRYRKGITPAYQIAETAKKEYQEALNSPDSMKAFNEECSKVDENDSILIIFTTGSTGLPKPAMLTNIGIVCQAFVMEEAFELKAADSLLVNLPPSHVGGTAEQFFGILYVGGTAIILHIFDAEKSLDAIQKYKVNLIGQIPALFNLQWRLPNYNDYDISSLQYVLYAGQAADRPFVERLSTMAKPMTGYGLTEICGFCTCSTRDSTIDDVVSSTGFALPITPVTIRKPMKEDGSAGEEIPIGEVGEVCVAGPQIFKGYFGNDEATKVTISTDGILYSGDLGFMDDKGLHIAGRRKFIIKPKGYQVFPPDVEAFIADLPQVEFVGVIGAKHAVFTDGIIAYVKLKEGQSLTEDQIYVHCKGMAAYKRPSLIVFLDEFPLNRVAKTDYLVLRERVEEDIAEARAKGGWDAK